MATEGPPADQSPCTSANAAFEQGELEKARDGYMDVLASDPNEACAAAGIAKVTKAARAEKKFCEEGEKLAQGDDAAKAEARRRYVAALEKNVESACATKGLSGGEATEKKEEKNGLARAKDNVTNFLAIIGAGLVAVLVLIGICMLVWTGFKRARHPSLAVKAFTDGGIEAKVGIAVATLTEKHLAELSRQGRRPTEGYALDLVVADVELVAENEGLATAMGGLAEEPQFKLAIALLDLIDRNLGNHLIVKGDLAPEGEKGRGLMLSMQSQKYGLQASGALWNPMAVTVPLEQKDDDPEPYYELAGEAAGWVQFEAARSLNRQVELLTRNGKSFAELTQGIADQRAMRPAAAAERYAEALLLDPENVGALVNLACLVARYGGRYELAAELLMQAGAILRRRHEEFE
jgi:tetratricopeptide (TPR) repeat protein